MRRLSVLVGALALLTAGATHAQGPDAAPHRQLTGDPAQHIFAALQPVACTDSGECPTESTVAKATTSDETVIITFPGYQCTYSPTPACTRNGSGDLVPFTGYAEWIEGGLADRVYNVAMVLCELDDSLVGFDDGDPPTVVAPPLICSLDTGTPGAFRCLVGE